MNAAKFTFMSIHLFLGNPVHVKKENAEWKFAAFLLHNFVLMAHPANKELESLSTNVDQDYSES